MNAIRIAAVPIAIFALIGAIAISPVGAQQTGQTSQVQFVAYDGLTLESQPPATQQQFQSAYGAQAGEIWVFEHNAELAARGFPIPPGYVAGFPPPVETQSGAQTGGRSGSSSDDDDESDNEQNNDNDEDEDDSDNDEDEDEDDSDNDDRNENDDSNENDE